MSAHQPMQIMDHKGNAIKKIATMLRFAPAFVHFALCTRKSKIRPNMYKFFHSLRENEAKGLRVGVAGFCWGGKATLFQSGGKGEKNLFIANADAPH